MWPVFVEGKDRRFEKLHNHLPCGQCLWKGRTEVLRNYIITYHVASGCGKNRLTEDVRNYIITYHVASGCGREGLKI
jgi:hypothetical protein